MANAARKESSLVYWTSYYVFRLFVKVVYRGKCINRSNLPTKGPYIAVINHNSLMDIPTMALAVNQRVVTMVKHSLFSVPVLGWWLEKVGMFPVRRGESDQQAFEHALTALRRGRVLYMAPEGTRKHDPDSPPRPHTGFVRLAQLADCPVVPIGITGTREALPPGAKFPRLSKIMANVGKPIYLEKIPVNEAQRERLQRQANEVMQAVYRLRDELLEKYYKRDRKKQHESRQLILSEE